MRRKIPKPHCDVAEILQERIVRQFKRSLGSYVITTHNEGVSITGPKNYGKQVNYNFLINVIEHEVTVGYTWRVDLLNKKDEWRNPDNVTYSEYFNGDLANPNMIASLDAWILNFIKTVKKER